MPPNILHGHGLYARSIGCLSASSLLSMVVNTREQQRLICPVFKTQCLFRSHIYIVRKFCLSQMYSVCLGEH